MATHISEGDCHSAMTTNISNIGLAEGGCFASASGSSIEVIEVGEGEEIKEISQMMDHAINAAIVLAAVTFASSKLLNIDHGYWHVCCVIVSSQFLNKLGFGEVFQFFPGHCLISALFWSSQRRFLPRFMNFVGPVVNLNCWQKRHWLYTSPTRPYPRSCGLTLAVRCSDEAPPEDPPTLSIKVVLHKRKPRKWSIVCIKGLMIGDWYWGGKDEDPVTATDVFIRNKDFVSQMKHLLGNVPNESIPEFKEETCMIS